MQITEEILNQHIENLRLKHETLKKGELNLISFATHFPKLSKYVPGIFPEAMITLLAPTNVGKSKFTKYCTILIPYWLSKVSNLKYKTIYVSLEESKEVFMNNLLVYLLLTKEGVETDFYELNGYLTPYDDSMFAKLESCKPELLDILKNVYIVESNTNPTGIYLDCIKIAEELGTINQGDKNNIASYTPNDPNTIVTVVCDHISLITEEYDNRLNKTLTQREAMQKWSSLYCLKIFSKIFKWAVWNVQQTTMTSESFEHKKAGALEPSLDNAGENKTILRDSHIILTLFSPYNAQLEAYRGFNIKRIRDRYVALGVIKSRYSKKNLVDHLAFEGAAGLYTEINQEDQDRYWY